MRFMLVLVALAALACSDDKPSTAATTTGATGGAAKKGLDRAQYAQVEIESECARLAANAGVGDLETYREAALKKVEKTKQDYFAAVQDFGADVSLRQEIDKKSAECRRASGWVEDGAGPNGETIWKRATE